MKITLCEEAATRKVVIIVTIGIKTVSDASFNNQTGIVIYSFGIQTINLCMIKRSKSKQTDVATKVSAQYYWPGKISEHLKERQGKSYQHIPRRENIYRQTIVGNGSTPIFQAPPPKDIE